MEHKLCGCPNDIPPSKKVLELPPRPNRMSEGPHFKIGGKTSPGRFSRHFYNLYPNAKEDERSDRTDRTCSVPNFYFPCSSEISNTPPRLIMKSSATNHRLTLSPVKEHPAVIITVFLTVIWPEYGTNHFPQNKNIFFTLFIQVLGCK